MELSWSKWQTQRPENPLVSVIIPTKDRPNMLCEAVQSALNQTYPYVEVVVINDAGIDVRHKLTMIPKSSSITYVNLLHNSERSKSRNYGISIANGDYITYLDDDDIYYPNHIETLLGVLTSKKIDIAYTDSLMAQQSIHNNTHKTIRKICFYSHDFNFEKLLVDNYIPILCIMHKKKCIEKSGYFDEKISTHEDWDLLIRLAQHYNFFHVKQITSEYRVRDDNTNTTNSKLPKFLETYKYIYEKYPLPPFASEFTSLDRKRALFAINIRAYSYICDLISNIEHSHKKNIATNAHELLNKCGASQKQIISATIYLQSKFEKNTQIQRRILLKSINVDQENYLSWISLCHNYIQDGNFELVEFTLKTLIEASPLDLTLYDSLISIMKILNKNKLLDDLKLRKEYISRIKNYNSENKN
jgi:glycosyltransferase involved in cell wall biosynthesis